MSALLDIRDKLRDTHAAVVRMESELSANREDEGLSLMLESLIRRQESLEAAFLEAAGRERIEVCSYRLIREQNTTLPIAALADSLRNFQTWLTTIFDAIKSGAKKKARPSTEMVQQTTLDFGYVFAGSLGIVFTVPNERLLNERLLRGESDLDLAVDAMFKMVHSRQREELVEFAHRFGISAIRRMYDWANTHARYLVSADIKWRRGDQIRKEVLLQAPEALNLCKLIDASSEVEGKTMTVIGQLVGSDTVTGIFHLRSPDSPDIKGHLSRKFSYPGELTLDRNYTAVLLATRTIYYATDSEDITYELLELRPL
jgi:hypothetical protein